MAPSFIFAIRHGEKPNEGGSPDPPFGVDSQGSASIHGLVPRGWQRAGALVTMFAPRHGSPRAPLVTPDRLVAAPYGSDHDTRSHRPYLTLAPLGEALGLGIDARFTVGEESNLAEAILSADNTATLICWEHAHIPLIAVHFPATGSADIPLTWADERFDLIWCFTRSGRGATYEFSAIGQRLLSGDAEP